ncbi:hypothetical protein HispidOSU_027442 [Sigmodon hispidus]
MPRKASARCQATGSQPPRRQQVGRSPWSLQRACRAPPPGWQPRAQHRGRSPATASPPVSPTVTVPHTPAPSLRGSSPAPPARLEPPPSRSEPSPGKDAPCSLPRPPPTDDLLLTTREEPDRLPQPTSATSDADQITGRPLGLRLPSPAPRTPSANRQARPRPCVLRAEASRSVEGAPCSPGGHTVHTLLCQVHFTRPLLLG